MTAWITLTAQGGADLLRRLLPRGAAWAEGVSATLDAVRLGLGDEIARWYARVRDLRTEQHPGTATETLADWEAALGLPDPSWGSPTTTAARQATAWARLTATGGAYAAYYARVASRFGKSVTILEPHHYGTLARCGEAICGEAVCSGGEGSWREWLIRYAAPADPYLQAAIEALKPANTTIVCEVI